MKALKNLLAIALLGAAATTNAQTAAPAKPVYVYIVCKQDAQHVVLSEVMTTAQGVTNDQLVAIFTQNHPDLKNAKGIEGKQFSSEAAANKDRKAMSKQLSSIGKSVTVLEAKR